MSVRTAEAAPQMIHRYQLESGLERLTPAERAERGKAARVAVPREGHAVFDPGPGRPDPIGLLEEQAKSRVPELVPIRRGRMMVSPFTYYRGAALPMASDLSRTPVSGLAVQACGDAHLSNFGIFGSAERLLVFDVNDFDETTPGPWEWDVKRLAASMEVAARGNGFGGKDRREIVTAAVASYRQAMRDFAKMTNLDVWYAHADLDQLKAQFGAQLKARQRKLVDKGMATARTRDSMQEVAKLRHADLRAGLRVDAGPRARAVRRPDRHRRLPRQRRRLRQGHHPVRCRVRRPERTRPPRARRRRRLRTAHRRTRHVRSGWPGACGGSARNWPVRQDRSTAYKGISVEEFEAKSNAFLRTAKHPTLGRGYLECAYVPMVELLGYLEANAFANYIASGGGRDFMRPISQQVYGIPRDRVIGSATTFQYTADDRGGTITHKAEADYLDDGPQKPIRIWSRTGRRPLVAAGNSNGDIPMLDFTQHPGKPSLRLLVLHDDGQREFAYTSGAEQALERADKSGWTIVSIKNDWATVF